MINKSQSCFCVLLLPYRCFGGEVSWDKSVCIGSSYEVTDETITHQIVDRPNIEKQFINRYGNAVAFFLFGTSFLLWRRKQHSEFDGPCVCEFHFISCYFLLWASGTTSSHSGCMIVSMPKCSCLWRTTSLEWLCPPTSLPSWRRKRETMCPQKN